MKDITDLDRCFSDFLNKLKSNLVEAQHNATEYMDEDAKDRIEIPDEARNTYQFIQYSESLKIKDAEWDGNEIKSSVYSDLLVGGDDPKWQDVPVGAFLEWGTGPLGEESNLYEHGYSYTTISPWDMHTWLQLQQTGNWGIVARPHLYPAFLHAQNVFKDNVKEAVKEAWMN